MMRLEKLEMKNYRQYKEITIDFPKDSEYDLHFIVAENGIGKTTLLNAINWCLYGDEPHLGLVSKALPILNTSVLDNMMVGDEVNVAVKATFNLNNGFIKFSRNSIFRKAEDNTPYEKGQNRNAVYSFNKEIPKTCEEEEFDALVRKYLPMKIRQYFFFDGEQLEQYIKNEKRLNVNQAVFQIAQIDILQSMYERIEGIEKDRRNALKKLTKNDKLRDIIEAYETGLGIEKKLKAEIEALESNFERNKERIREIENELGDDPDLQVLEQERSSLKNSIKNLEDEKIKYINYQKNFIREYGVILRVFPLIKSLLEIISEKEEKKLLPPKLDKKMLEKILKTNICQVCGRSLDADSTAYIESLLNQFNVSQKAAIVLTKIKGILQDKIEKTGKYPEECDKCKKILSGVNKKINTKQNDLAEIELKLSKVANKEYTKQIQKERRDLEILFESIRDKDLPQKKECLRRTGIELSKLEQDLKDAQKKDEKKISLKIEDELLESASDILEKIIEDMKEEVRKKISDCMETEFFELIWKKNSFKALTLDEHYIISLIDKNGRECLGSISAAEREIVVLAFTIALHKESGFEGPLIIDTPLGRTSGDYRASIAKVLKKISFKKQIIMYLTTDEYSTQVQDVFHPCASSKYKMNLIGEKSAELEVI